MGLHQKVRWVNLFLVASSLLELWCSRYVLLQGLPLSDTTTSLLSLFQPLCQWLEWWVKTPLSLGMTHMRVNSKKSLLRFSTYLFPKAVTSECSMIIKLYFSRKGTDSWLHLSGKIYSGQEKSFINKSKMEDTPRVSYFWPLAILYVFVPLQEIQLQIYYCYVF